MSTTAQEIPVVIRGGKACVLADQDHCIHQHLKDVLFHLLRLEEDECRRCGKCPLQTLLLKVEVEDDYGEVKIVLMNIMDFYEHIDDKEVSRHVREGKSKEKKIHDKIARRQGELTVQVDRLHHDCK